MLFCVEIVERDVVLNDWVLLMVFMWGIGDGVNNLNKIEFFGVF